MATVTRRLISPHFPYIPLVLTIGQTALTLDAFLDTGFDGGIVVPQALIAPEITPDTSQVWYLADGSAITAPAYQATVRLEHLGTFPVTVTAIREEALVGRRLISNFRIILDFGRRVIVER
jgi:predicted aspartyl protease